MGGVGTRFHRAEAGERSRVGGRARGLCQTCLGLENVGPCLFRLAQDKVPNRPVRKCNVRQRGKLGRAVAGERACQELAQSRFRSSHLLFLGRHKLELTGSQQILQRLSVRRQDPCGQRRDGVPILELERRQVSHDSQEEPIRQGCCGRGCQSGGNQWIDGQEERGHQVSGRVGREQRSGVGTGEVLFWPDDGAGPCHLLLASGGERGQRGIGHRGVHLGCQAENALLRARRTGVRHQGRDVCMHIRREEEENGHFGRGRGWIGAQQLPHPRCVPVPRDHVSHAPRRQSQQHVCQSLENPRDRLGRRSQTRTSRFNQPIGDKQIDKAPGCKQDVQILLLHPA